MLRGLVSGDTYTLPKMSRIMRCLRMTGLVPLILLVAACGGETDTDAGEVEAPVVTEAASETTAPPAAADESSTTTTAAPSTTAAESEATTTTVAASAEPLGPPAPDFTLELGSGGTFALSEQTQPVLILFWAEW